MFFTISVSAQPAKDSVTSFKVSGACEMCKQRIEHTLKLKGISSAIWDVDIKILALSYNPKKISLSKIHKLLAEAGHDTEMEKASDAVYNQLPACCHYREIEKRNTELNKQIEKSIANETAQLPAEAHFIKGVVLEENKKGMFAPLPGASVVWLGTNKGTVTDSTGVFSIPHFTGVQRLVVSYSGYRPDTMSITDIKELKIILATDKQLGEVKIFSKQRSTYVSALSPLRTQVMTEKELFKAACCNLSESFESNPAVDVSYNEAVTGSKQIQLPG